MIKDISGDLDSTENSRILGGLILYPPIVNIINALSNITSRIYHTGASPPFFFH